MSPCHASPGLESVLPNWYSRPSRSQSCLNAHLRESPRRVFSVLPPPPAAPEKPISENAYEAPCGSYLTIASSGIELLRPKVSVPHSFDSIPTYATPLKNCPARAPSAAVVRWLTGMPLLCVSDLGASARLPEVGRKPISRLKMPAKPSTISSLPLMPIFDWLKPFGPIEVIDLLLYGCTR